MKRSSFLGWARIPVVVSLVAVLASLVYHMVDDEVSYQSRHALLAPVATETPVPVVANEEKCPPSVDDILWGRAQGHWSWAYLADCDPMPRIPDGDDWFVMDSVTREFEDENMFVDRKDGIAQFGAVFTLWWISGPTTDVAQELKPMTMYHVSCSEAEVTMKVRYHDPGWQPPSRIRDLQGEVVCKVIRVTEVAK